MNTIKCRDPSCRQCSSYNPPVDNRPHIHYRDNIDANDGRPMMQPPRPQYPEEPVPQPHMRPAYVEDNPAPHMRPTYVEDNSPQHMRPQYPDETNAPYHSRTVNQDVIDDAYVLNYLLKKFKLDKSKLIHKIRRERRKESKLELIDQFYKTHTDIGYRKLKKQYQIFSIWNPSDLEVSLAEFEDFYEQYVRPYL